MRWFAGVFVLGMLAGVFVIVMAMRQRSQQLEMQHRERMAMIERGQVPTDPPHIARWTSAGRSGANSRDAIVIVGLAFIANNLVSRSTVPDVPPVPRQDDLR